MTAPDTAAARDLVSGRLPATPADLQQPLSPDAPATLQSHYRPVAVVRGDARNLGLRDNSVDLIVTSPPYFALRSYQDGGEHYEGQVGAEATPAEFVDTLIACTSEWMRVLKQSGSLWVNLGDSYSGGNRGVYDRTDINGNRGGGRRPTTREHGIRGKSLMGVPWRYALRCIDELGLILRAEVIWSKPNGLPESVTDRVRRSHEQWFHFTLAPRYFSAVDEVRERYAPSTAERNRYGRNAHAPSTYIETTRPFAREGTPDDYAGNPLGKLPGSVWTVPTEPLNVPEHLGVDHFAAFPSEWPRRIIQGWSPSGVCVECGEGRRPVSGTTCDECGAFRPNNAKQCPNCGHRRDWKQDRFLAGDTSCYDAGASTATDWSTPGAKAPRRVPVPMQSISGGYACGCPEPTAETRPAVVLDPFGGTGTTALVASVLGRVGVSVDLSSDYCRLARWRTTDPGERARAMRVEKPPKQTAGQMDLLGEPA